ncbi:MAG: F0F1 ATP synthase subunit B [Candidatus Omnitrophota bacterium]
MELLRLLSTNELVAQIISFLLLLFLLRLFVWKKILGLLDARKEKIAAEFQRIEETQQEVKQLKAGYESKLALSEEEARKKTQETLAEAKKSAEQIKKKAHEEAQDIIDNAKQNIKCELAKAKEELKAEIIDLSLKAAQEVIQEKLSEEQDTKLVRDFLDKMDEIK